MKKKIPSNFSLAKFNPKYFGLLWVNDSVLYSFFFQFYILFQIKIPPKRYLDFWDSKKFQRKISEDTIILEHRHLV